MIETIKEYLVKIGFKADTDGADKAQKAMDGIQKNAARLMTALKALAVGGTLQKIVGFFTDMARQDLQFQRLARQMWTTRENAEAVNRSLEVMGASLQDLWFSPELAQQFMQLRREALGMQAPEELQGQLKEVRSILFEVQRFRLTLQYLGQWVAFFFLTYMERPLAKLKKTIHDDTDDLQKNIPTAANKIGQALAALFRLVLAFLELTHKAWDALPKDIIAGLLAIGATAKMISAGPVGILIGLLLTALALYEDYQTWKDGGVSLFDWGKAEGSLARLKEIWDDFKEDFGGSWETFQGGIDRLTDGVGDLFEALGGWDTVAALFEGFLSTINWLVDSVGKLAGALGEVFGWISKIIKAIDDVSGWISQGVPEGSTGANFLQGTQLADINSIVNPQRAAGASSTKTQTNNINIYSSDPATAGQAVADETNGMAAWFDGAVTPAY